jgi:hypothetical protein
MLQRTVSLKSLLRIVGWCFLLYGLYVILLALTAATDVAGSITYHGPLIFQGPEEVRNYIFCGGIFFGNPVLPVLPRMLNSFGLLTPGPVLWGSIGMLCLSVTGKHANVIYVCFQVALLLVSLSVWFPIFSLLGSTNYDLASFAPFWLVTLALSLILLACYKPVMRFLRKRIEQQPHGDPPGGTLYEQPIVQYRSRQK